MTAVDSPARLTVPVDAAALTRALDGETHDVRERLRTRLSQPDFAQSFGLPIEAHRARTLAWMKLIAADGYGALGFPKDCDGAGRTADFFAAFETLGTFDQSLTIKFGVQFGLFGGSVLGLGTAWHHHTFLPAIGRGELLGCFAMSELGHGSNVRELETTATYDPTTQEFVVHTPSDSAHKEWLGNAANDGQMATVFAQLIVAGVQHGVHALLVRIRDDAGRVMPGVRIEDTGVKMGLNGIDNGRLWFDQVRVPRPHLLNRFGDVSAEGVYTSPIASPGRRFFTMLSTLVGGRITVAGTAISGAKTGLAVALRYTEHRTQFATAEGTPTRLLDYPWTQRRLLVPLAAIYACDLGLKEVARRFLTGNGEDREVEGLAAGVKAYASWESLNALQMARECCGGQGYLPINRIAQMRVDCDIDVTFEGDNTVLMQLVARALLTDYRAQFGADRLGAAVKYVSQRAAQVMSGFNPIAARHTDVEHLRDADWQLTTLRYREDRLVASAARRIKHRIDEGMESGAAFVDIQDHLMLCASAHMERVLLEGMRAQMAAMPADTAAMLEPLAQLFALSRLERHEGWFLEKGVFEGTKSRAVREQVNALCREIRPSAVAYGNGFGIPDAVLGAPIAFSPLPTARDRV